MNQKLVGGDVKFYKAAVNNTTESGAQQAANLLQAHPDMTVMFSWGGDVTTGGLQAAAEAGKTDPNTFFFGSVAPRQIRSRCWTSTAVCCRRSAGFHSASVP